MLNQRLHAMTAQITKMTPQQRQKFALLHKNDPILVGLTKFINDQEGAVRASLKAQQEPLPSLRPPVVDDVISQMAPNGLAKLPVPPLEQMPDGGIAGQPQEMPMGKPTTYKKGGEVKVKKYAGATGSWVQEDGIRGFLKRPISSLLPSAGITGGGVMGSMTATPQATDPAALQRALEAANKMKMAQEGEPLTPQEADRIKARFTQNPVRAQQMMDPGVPASPIPAPNRQALQGIPPTPQAASVPQTLPTPVAPTAPAKAVAQAPVGGAAMGAGPAPSGYSLPPMPTPPQFGGFDVNAEMAKAKESLASGPVAGDEIKALTAAEVKGATEARDRLKADQEAEGVYGAEREQRLKAREEKLNKQESENKGLALLDAGLAIMAGNSPHAMQNIGAGALVGTKRLREGQKMIDEGRQRLEDAFSQLDEFRRSERVANRKDMRAAEAEITNKMNGGLKMLIDGVGKREELNSKEAGQRLEAAMRMAVAKTEAEGRQYSADLQYRGGIEQQRIAADASGYSARLRLQGDQIQAGNRKAELSAHKEEANNIRWTDTVRKVYGDVATEVQNEARNGGILSRFAENPALLEQEINRRAVTRLKAMRVPESHYSSSAVDAGGASGPADFVYDPKTKRLTAPPR